LSTTSPSTKRCKHLLPPEACAFCRGLVTGRNQTRIYGAGEAETPEPEVPPRVWNQEMDDTVLNSNPTDELDKFELPGIQETTEHESRPVGWVEPGAKPMLPTQTDRQGANAMNEKKKCKYPGCDMKVVAQGFCLGCYDKWRRGTLPGDWPPYQKVRFTKNDKPKEPPPKALKDVRQAVAKAAVRADIFRSAMQELQARFDQALGQCRQIRETMVLLKEATGVEWEIPALP
jgi:hypothetical protein